MGIFIFKPVLGWVVFYFNLSMDGLVYKSPVLGRVEFFLPFNSRFLDVGKQNFVKKSTLCVAIYICGVCI
jgi:hypothetical protein